MNCRECVENMDIYIDGELEEKDHDRIRAHIECCEKCRMEYEGLLKIVESMNEYEYEPLPEGFDKALRMALEEAAVQNEKVNVRQKSWNMRLRKIACAAAAVAVVVGAAAVYENAGVDHGKGADIAAMKSRPEQTVSDLKGKEALEDKSSREEDAAADMPSGKSDIEARKAKNQTQSEATESESDSEKEAECAAQQKIDGEAEDGGNEVFDIAEAKSEIQEHQYEKYTDEKFTMALRNVGAENADSTTHGGQESEDTYGANFIDAENYDGKLITMGIDDILNISLGLDGETWAMDYDREKIDVVKGETVQGESVISCIFKKTGTHLIKLSNDSGKSCEIKIEIEN